VRQNAAGRFCVRERENGVGCATHLERAGPLQVLALEEEAGAGTLIQGGRSKHGRAMNMRRNAAVRITNDVQIRTGGHFSPALPSFSGLFIIAQAVAKRGGCAASA
jgi:hypothetical protein